MARYRHDPANGWNRRDTAVDRGVGEGPLATQLSRSRSASRKAALVFPNRSFAGPRGSRLVRPEGLDRVTGCRSALSRICASTRREGAGAPLVQPPAGDGYRKPQPRLCTLTGPPPDHGVSASSRSPCPSGDGRSAEPHPVQRLRNRCSGNPLPSADNDCPVLRSAASSPPRAPSDRRPRRRRRAVLPPGP